MENQYVCRLVIFLSRVIASITSPTIRANLLRSRRSRNYLTINSRRTVLHRVECPVGSQLEIFHD